jgi:hypothetical protein
MVATDGSRRVNLTTHPWSFEVLAATGNWNDANGPGGSGCGLGESIESQSHDGKFTCDCDKTGMTGPNCGTPQTLARSTAGLIGGLSAAIITAILVVGVAIRCG